MFNTLKEKLNRHGRRSEVAIERKSKMANRKYSWGEHIRNENNRQQIARELHLDKVRARTVKRKLDLKAFKSQLKAA